MTQNQQKLAEGLRKLSPLEVSQMRMLYKFSNNNPDDIAKEIIDDRKVQGMISLIEKQLAGPRR